MKFYEHRMEKIKAVFNWSGEKTPRMPFGELVNRSYTTSLPCSPQSIVTRNAPACTVSHSLASGTSRQYRYSPAYRESHTPGNLENYAEAMTCAALHFKEQGVTHFIFGDIYLHDVRAYRERQLAPLGIEVVEPLWE